MRDSESTLLDIGAGIGSHGDDINPLISQYVLRAGAPYLSPAYVLSANKADSGVPYWMQGIAMQTCNNNYISAPAPYQASKITHQASVLYTAGQYAVGQAPTNGIYTGVEDKC